MFSKKLINTLKIIPKRGKELDNLRKFINSEYHGIDKAAVAVFNVWDKTLQNDFATLDNKKVWQLAFPLKAYQDNQMRVYCSMLTDLIEQFLIQEELKKDTILQKQLLAKAFQARDKQQNFDKTNQELAILIKSQPLSAEKYLQSAILRDCIFKDNRFKNIAQSDTTLSEYLSNLDQFYIIQKLKIINAINDQKTVLKDETQIVLEDEIINIATQNTDNQLIAMYLNLIELCKTNTIAQYEKVKNYFNEHKNNFVEDDKKSILQHLQNFLTRHHNQGNNWATRPLFELKIETLSKPLSETSFLNMVSIACMAGELDLGEKFVAENAAELQKNQDIIVNIAYCNLYFYRFVQSKDESYLKKVEHCNSQIASLKKDLVYNLLLRVVLCKTYFELQKMDITYASRFETEVKNAKQFLLQKSFASGKRTENINFFNFIYKIYKNSHNPSELQLIHDEIPNANTGNKAWLRSHCK